MIESTDAGTSRHSSDDKCSGMDFFSKINIEAASRRNPNHLPSGFDATSFASLAGKSGMLAYKISCSKWICSESQRVEVGSYWVRQHQQNVFELVFRLKVWDVLVLAYLISQSKCVGCLSLSISQSIKVSKSSGVPTCILLAKILIHPSTHRFQS